MEIGVAYAARLGLHQDIAGSGRGNVQFQKFQGFSELLDNSCVHLGRHVSLRFNSLPDRKFELINGVLVFLSKTDRSSPACTDAGEGQS
jgi:hypothetical protein